MRNKGFTLIELMIVLVVLGILVAVGLPRFTSFIEEGRVSATRQEMGAIQSAAKMYEMHMREMPNKVRDLIVAPPTRADGTAWMAGVEVWKGPYMDGEEQDVCYDAWGHPYIIYYNSAAPPYGFVLYSYGPDGKPSTSDDITVWLRYDGSDNTHIPASGYLTAPPATPPSDAASAGPSSGSGG